MSSRTLIGLDGNAQRLDGGAMFGNAPRALWSRWSEPDADNRIALACRALLVREPGRNLLLETGIGAFFEPKLRERYGVVEAEHVLLRSLAAAGLTHEQVDAVVLSHLHFDHAGGLLSAFEAGEDPRLLFPNARLIVSRRAWERARTPHVRDRASFVPGLCDLLVDSGRLHLVETPDDPVLGEGYRFHVSEGHTPGLFLTEVEMPAGPVLFAADLAPGVAWAHLPITMGYDRFPERLVEEKRAIFEQLLARGGRLFFTHDPQVAMGRLVRDDRGRFGVTETLAAVDGLEA